MVLNSGLDRTIKLWRITDGSLLRTFSGEGPMMQNVLVRGLDISPDGDQFASARVDKKVQLWDMKSGELLKTFLGHTDYVMSVAFSPDRQTLVSGGGGYDRSVRVWNIASEKQEQVLEGHQGWILDVAP